MDKERKYLAEDKNSMVNENQDSSEQNSKLGEVEMKVYDELFPDHKPQDDVAEVSSTDDV